MATVSHVMNGRDDRRISAATRERVLAAARRLNYAPNQSARSLRRRRTERVCLVTGSIGVPAYDRIATDLHEMADANGYGVISMIVNSPDRAERTVELLRQRIADGALIATGLYRYDESALNALGDSGFPLVVIGNHVRPHGFDVIAEPEFDACVEAIEHLVTTGRRRIAFIGHRSDFARAGHSQRFAAYREVLNRHGLPLDRGLTVPGADDRVTGYRRAAALLTSPEPPDALFVASYRAAVSAIWAARDHGVDVPGDVAVIGAGNIDDGLITQPPLSTVGPQGSVHTTGPRLLFERIESSEPLPGREFVTPWTFVRRKSG